MAGHVPYMIKQSAQQVCNLVRIEPAVVWMGSVHQGASVPLPVGREYLREPGCLIALISKTGGVGVGKRAGDFEPDLPSTPVIGKTDIQQVR